MHVRIFVCVLIVYVFLLQWVSLFLKLVPLHNLLCFGWINIDAIMSTSGKIWINFLISLSNIVILSLAISTTALAFLNELLLNKSCISPFTIFFFTISTKQLKPTLLGGRETFLCNLCSSPNFNDVLDSADLICCFSVSGRSFA